MITWETKGWRMLYLYVNGVTVNSWWIDNKNLWPRTRKPFQERSRNSSFSRSGTIKVSGEHILRYAAELGADVSELRPVINQMLADNGWPPTKEEA